MKILRGVDLVTVAALLWMSAGLFYTIMLRGVERAAPLQRWWEFNGLSRVWREHKRHFPNSRLRKAVVILSLAGVVCLVMAGLIR